MNIVPRALRALLLSALLLAGQAFAAEGSVNINTADSALLATLPGVGPAISQRIIAWRTANGPFAAISDLQSVSGIGPAMMAKVTDLITVG